MKCEKVKAKVPDKVLVGSSKRGINYSVYALTLLMTLFMAANAFAHGSSGSTHVKGYTRSDGTHVKAYARAAPGKRAERPAGNVTAVTAPSVKPTGLSAISKATTPSQTSVSAGMGSKQPYSTTIKQQRAIKRDRYGHIQRSAAARHSFMKQTGYPNGRPGYVVDHVIPLKRGGADDPSNMQWQTVEDAKAKDKWE